MAKKYVHSIRHKHKNSSVKISFVQSKYESNRISLILGLIYNFDGKKRLENSLISLILGKFLAKHILMSLHDSDYKKRKKWFVLGVHF